MGGKSLVEEDSMSKSALDKFVAPRTPGTPDPFARPLDDVSTHDAKNRASREMTSQRLDSALNKLAGIPCRLATALAVAACLVLGTAASAWAASGSWEGRDGAWWYRYDNGGYATNWESIDGSWYHFGASGWMQTGWLDLDGTWYYLTSSGAMAEGWESVGGAWYYLNPGSGAMAEGWKSVGGSWYYLTPGSGAMVTGWEKVNGSWYWMNSSGAMRTGWLPLNGTWYYLTSSGAMTEGWEKVGGEWYYLNPGSGAMAEGWKSVDGTWYYLSPDGGAMVTGWQWINDEYYYFESSGAMQANRWVGDYYVGPSGAMLRSQWVDSYYVGADGKWIPGYTDPAKPADPTKPGAAQEPTATKYFTYAVGDYVTGLGNSASDVKTGTPSASGGTYESLPGGGFNIVSSGGFDLMEGYSCGHGVYIVGCTVSSGDPVVIPDTIDGEPVVYANLCSPDAVSADPRLILSQVDATQAKHLRWLTVGGAPEALYCQGATELRFLSSQENALLKSFDGSTLTNLEVLQFGTIPQEFSLAKDSLVEFSALYQATDKTIPYLDFSDAPNLQSFAIDRRGGNVTTLGPLTASGYTLEGCDALTTVKLPFQNIDSFDPYHFPMLETLVLTGDPLTSEARNACETWAEETGGSLTLALP